MLVNTSPNSVNTQYFDAPVSHFCLPAIMSSEQPGPINTIRSYQLGDLESGIAAALLDKESVVLRPVEVQSAVPVEGEVSGQDPMTANLKRCPTRKAPPPLDNLQSSQPAAPAQAHVHSEASNPSPATPAIQEGTSQDPKNSLRRPGDFETGNSQKPVSTVSRSTSRRSAFIDAEGRQVSGGAFLGGAGTTGPAATAELDNETAQRHMEAHANLTSRQRSKVIKAEGNVATSLSMPLGQSYHLCRATKSSSVQDYKK